MRYVESSHLALAMLAGTLIAEPANATMPGPPSPPPVSVPSVPRPPSINVPVPNVTPNINTQIRDSLPRGGRGRDSTSSSRSRDDDRSAKRSGGERRANRSGGDNSASRAKVGVQAAAADDSPSDGKAAAAAAYTGPTDQMMWSEDNCDPSDGDYVAPSSKAPKPVATMMPVDLPPTTAPTPPPQGGTSDITGLLPTMLAPIAPGGTSDVTDLLPTMLAPIVPGADTPSSGSGKKGSGRVDQTLVLSGPNGDSPLVVHKYGDLDPKQVADVLWTEKQKYGDDGDPNQRYKPVGQPSADQDCAGHHLQQVFGNTFPNVVVEASNFYQNFIQKLNVPEVARANVAPKDTGVFFNQSGTAAHIVTVTDVTDGKITILSKDGKESPRQGVLDDSFLSRQFTATDGLVSQYGGNIKFYRINPNAVQIKGP